MTIWSAFCNSNVRWALAWQTTTSFRMRMMTVKKPHFGRSSSPMMGRLSLAQQQRNFHAFEHPHHGQRRFVSSLAACVEDDIENNDSDDTVFQVTAKFPPAGDQPEAIAQLVRQLKHHKDRFSILRGVTGTGKTLVMSHVIAAYGKPVLVLCHNKTLAAQLARELQSFLGNSVVELFVSYYNHYRPESYSETTGKFLAKRSSINRDLDTLRHRATRALLTRQNVVVVASVSCLYGLGLPEEYLQASMELKVHHDSSAGMDKGGEDESDSIVVWDDFIEKLHDMSYEYNGGDDDVDFDRGQYQVVEETQRANGSSKSVKKLVTLWPPHESFPMQIELHESTVGDVPSNEDSRQGRRFEIHAIREGHAKGFASVPQTRLFPARHHVTTQDRLEQACLSIEDELRDSVKKLVAEGKHVEAERLQARVVDDLFLLRETGFCKGLENYSRHFTRRQAGEPPATLLDYLKLVHGDCLLIVDESHVALPQLRSMYAGDQARKRQLVKHGYRLPSALDNRPLQEDEFWERVGQTLFVSATPSKQELDWAQREPVDMIIRPTFVCDPEIQVRSPRGQLEDLLENVKARAAKNERTLAITLTKRDSEDLASFLLENGVKSTYLHSGLSTVERSEALRSLQSGEVDCLVGVNCLREGLDLPQVSLVAVLNADSEGFLRSDTALLQIVGRAARNINGQAIFYANRVTESMRRCIESTAQRRQKQLEFNERNGKSMRSTKGSSTMSFFDLLKDQIEAEQQSVESSKPEHDKRPVTTTASTVLRQPPNRPLTEGASNETIETGHIPSSPGVYVWKDATGSILYIGKAVKLRSRVKSYLAPSAKHGARIRSMLQRAASVDVLLTASERDALVLESHMIKNYQPLFNVLLKDDEHYPYICASLGDRIPRLSVVPKRPDGAAASSARSRYFGPYTSFKEINEILDGIESKYDLRAQNFQARHGSLPKEDYKKLFEKVLREVFGSTDRTDGRLAKLRREYEEAGLLFDSAHNSCRDVVTVLPVEDSQTEARVSVLQLRDGLVAGHFSYSCEVPYGLTSDEEFGSAAHAVLTERHYPSGEESGGAFSWFPNSILLSHNPHDAKSLKSKVRLCRANVEPNRKGAISVSTAAASGPLMEVDARALEFAVKNAKQLSTAGSFNRSPALPSSTDGSAASDLVQMLELDGPPSRIECYDISHTQGEYPVGSRVVFVDGQPAPHLYRKFNVRSVPSVDDYACIEEVLERRFRRAWVNGKGGTVDASDPWAMPDLVVIDGGRGQLSAAIKAMSRASVVPAGSRNGSVVKNGTDRSASVAICALAKGQEEIYIHGQKHPVNNRPDSPAVLLLRALRDESHRFALNAHRQRRSLRKSFPSS